MHIPETAVKYISLCFTDCPPEPFLLAGAITCLCTNAWSNCSIGCREFRVLVQRTEFFTCHLPFMT